jgi:isocitrate dehydrogenase kinase/phosphatase
VLVGGQGGASERPGEGIAAAVAGPPYTVADDAGHAASAAIATVLIEGFDRHYRLFRETSARAKERFERAAWLEVQRAVQERIRFYDDRVRECVERLRQEFDVEALDFTIWQEAKLRYIGLLVDHRQPELAETFFNSVITRILRRTYSDNDLIFVRAAISTEGIPSDPPIYRSYYPRGADLRECVERILDDFGWSLPFADRDADVDRLLAALDGHRHARWAHLEPNHQVQVLGSAFYRNKAAYVVGRMVNGHDELPFVVPVLHERRRLVVDALVADPEQIDVIFSLSRAYFMVDMHVPSGYVEFLHRMMPTRPRAELYTMLGLGKQGKTLFYRDLLEHLRHSQDVFVEAPGIRGQVMLVFTLPSFPYVFKVIRDAFGPGKSTDRATVRSKFAMVKQVDRVGRLADTLEFTELALPRSRFSDEVVRQLTALAPSMVEDDGEILVIRHCYAEQRMVPLNIYLDRATPEELRRAVVEYGNAIRDLAIVNVFPGDMLWRNFGVTRDGRVVFYDYDELEYLTDVRFRRMPEAPSPEAELAAEPWFGVAREDVFPEEFATFLLGDPRLRELFLAHHAELLAPEFWQECQRRVESGEFVDFFPYPESIRFRNGGR